MREEAKAGIVSSKKIQIYTNSRGTGKNMALLRCVYFYLCLLGIFLTIQEVTKLNMKNSVVLSILFIFCLSVELQRFLKREILLFLLFVGGVSVIFFRKQIISGFFVVENSIRAQLQTYYGITLAQKTVPLEGEQGELFILLFFGLLVLGLGDLVIHRGRVALLALIEVFVLALEILCGSQFKNVGMYFMIGGFLALYTMGTRRGGKNKGMLLQSGLWAGGILCLLFLISGIFIAPILYKKAEPWNKKLYEQVQETLGKINQIANSQNGIFGDHTPTSDGSLNNYPVDQDEETDLKIFVPQKPENSLYLRGFVGDTYEGMYWHGADVKQFDNAFPEKDAKYQVQNLFYTYLKERASEETECIRIERVHPGGDYGYVPYGCETPNDKNLIGDTNYACAEKEIEYQGFVNWKRLLGTEIEENNSDIEKRYQQYVADQYLKIPVEGLERLKAFCEKQNVQSVQEVVDFVVPTVKEECFYSMDLQPVPAEKDFAEYFFFDQKKGYCIHYATTATLMFRMMGVPARYVTGYVVPADLFQQKGTEFVAEVPDAQAHAWVEIYRSGKGWVPVEVTPGYESETLPSEMPTEVETTPEPQAPEMVTQMPTVIQSTPEMEEVPQQKPEEVVLQQEQNKNEHAYSKILKKVMLVVVCLAGILFLLISIVEGRRKIIVKNRKQLYFQKNRNKGVIELSYGIYEMLKEAKVQVACEKGQFSDREFGREVEKHFSALEEGEYVKVIHLVEKASYSEEMITEEEWKACVHLYKKIEKEIWKKLDKKKKIWWKYMKCYSIS